MLNPWGKYQQKFIWERERIKQSSITAIDTNELRGSNRKVPRLLSLSKVLPLLGHQCPKLHRVQTISNRN